MKSQLLIGAKFLKKSKDLLLLKTPTSDQDVIFILLINVKLLTIDRQNFFIY